MIRIERIKQKLGVLKPHQCIITNESHKHAGHAEHGADSHFKVQIAASVFGGKSLVAKHKIIHELLAEEFANGLHALSIEIL